MADAVNLQNELHKVRSELKNIRQTLETLKRVYQKDIASVRNLLRQNNPEGCIASRVHHEQQCQVSNVSDDSNERKDHECWQFKPIGYLQSVFTEKNGTPRQASICQSSQAVLEIRKDLYNNPSHSLEGLDGYSHVWILYVFHKNNCVYNKAKVAPPRLNGARVGVFSTRSPYRPCPIGLSLVKLNHISGSSLHLSGIDILDGTPVLDVKPYIPHYDNPEWDGYLKNVPDTLNKDEYLKSINSDHQSNCTSNVGERELQSAGNTVQSKNDTFSSGSDRTDAKSEDVNPVTSQTVSVQTSDEQLTSLNAHICHDRHLRESDSDEVELNGSSQRGSSMSSVRVEGHLPRAGVTYPEWIQKPPIASLTVIFSERAENDLRDAVRSLTQSQSMMNKQAMRDSIISVLAADPRSTYRRKHCTDRLYYLTLDSLHITCWFDEDVVEVLKIRMLAKES